MYVYAPKGEGTHNMLFSFCCYIVISREENISFYGIIFKEDSIMWYIGCYYVIGILALNVMVAVDLIRAEYKGYAA